MIALRPKRGLCQGCQQIKVLAVDRTQIVEGRAIHTRLCFHCFGKVVKQ
jgi:hypothetical protein